MCASFRLWLLLFFCEFGVFATVGLFFTLPLSKGNCLAIGLWHLFNIVAHFLRWNPLDIPSSPKNIGRRQTQDHVSMHSYIFTLHTGVVVCPFVRFYYQAVRMRESCVICEFQTFKIENS
jgi:hypothetical protein